MPFEPGHVKTGGRQKGTPNLVTKEIRSVLKELVHSELISLLDRVKQMDDDQRTEILVKLVPYVLPAIERVSHREDEPFAFD